MYSFSNCKNFLLDLTKQIGVFAKLLVYFASIGVLATILLIQVTQQVIELK